MLHAGRGEALLKQKTSALLGRPLSLFVLGNDSAYGKTGCAFPQSGRANYR
jgi:hypothetical protein